MNPTINTRIDFDELQIVVSHYHEAALSTVWDAFTRTELLEKWWAPEPYKAVVVNNNFEEGGKLFYYMLSPEGSRHYCISEYLVINSLKSYEVSDAFCDENKVVNTSFPRLRWMNTFSSLGAITTVTNTLTFQTSEDMAQLLKMGFEEGYKTALNQLHALLVKHN